ncbi:MAG TPA: hypothetical protein VEG08_06335 [Terriglobales bacterium]|nr:hypothetical protein [Terriglobales bacterium]
MDMRELAEVYRNKPNEELLRLALTPEELTQDASVALADELARRGINRQADLEAARREEEKRKAEEERNLGMLGFLPHLGVGRMRFGRANRTQDPQTGRERFKTTIFIVLFWFPLIPTATYLVERKRGSPDALTVVEKLPLDWEQVLTVWVVGAGSILAIIWLIKLITSDAAWTFVHRYWR